MNIQSGTPKWRFWFRVHSRYIYEAMGYNSPVAASHGKCGLHGPHSLSMRLQWPRIFALNWLFLSPLCINTLKDRKPKSDGKPKKLVIYDKHEVLVLDTSVHFDHSDHFGNVHSFYKSVSEQRAVNLKLLNKSHIGFLNIILRKGNLYKLLTCYPWLYEVTILLAFFLQWLLFKSFLKLLLCSWF